MERKIEIIINNSEITAGTRGASLGPQAIFTAARKFKNSFFSRYKLHTIETQNHALDHSFTENSSAKYIKPYAKVFHQIASQTAQVLTEGNFPFILAGDHGSAAGTIAGIKKAFPNKELGVIWIDAHADIHSPYTTPSGNMHGMPLNLCIGDDNTENQVNTPDSETIGIWNELKHAYTNQPKIKPENLVFIGVRDTEEQENKLIEKHHITIHTVETVRKDGAKAIAEKSLEQLQSCDIIYVSFDVDSMDPELTSLGTGTPVGNGIFPQEAEEILTLLAKNEKTCCMEVVEVNPCLDNKQNFMAETAFSLIEKTVTNL